MSLDIRLDPTKESILVELRAIDSLTHRLQDRIGTMNVLLEKLRSNHPRGVTTFIQAIEDVVNNDDHAGAKEHNDK